MEKVVEPINPRKSRDILDVLKACASDPMWANHAEINKTTLNKAIAEINFLRQRVEELEASQARSNY
jgi:hypothetical protein